MPLTKDSSPSLSLKTVYLNDGDFMLYMIDDIVNYFYSFLLLQDSPSAALHCLGVALLLSVCAYTGHFDFSGTMKE